jgi:ADP-ribosylglycohydrolase
MRILPLAFYLHTFGGDLSFDEIFDIIHNVSSLTHAHKRSQIACGIYLLVADCLLVETDLKKAVNFNLEKAESCYQKEKELKHFKRIFKADFANLPEEGIRSSGYIVDTLEAAIWCLLNTDNYKDCVLKAVNLGDDTDTVAAVAGGFAGIFYGVDAIPKDWLQQLARLDYIKELCEKFYRSLQ